MSRFVDLSGKPFTNLVAISPEGKTKSGSYRWLCQCDCGKTTIVPSGNLVNGHTLSCGCRRKPHGYFGTLIYGVWNGMKKRCADPDNPRYGGRGIKVCEEWQEFKPFLDWAMKNGYKKGFGIDRRNNDGDYEPGNCRFVTTVKNNQNRGNTRLSAKKVILIRFLLEKSTLEQKQIGNFFGVPQNTISQIKHGHLWSTIKKEDWIPIHATP